MAETNYNEKLKREIVRKYNKALKIAESNDTLRCHVLGIKNIIAELKTREPTFIEIAWVDYFIE